MRVGASTRVLESQLPRTTRRRLWCVRWLRCPWDWKTAGAKETPRHTAVLCLGLEQNVSCVLQGELSKASDSQNVNLRSGKSTSPVSLLEMQILNQKLYLCLASRPGNSEVWEPLLQTLSPQQEQQWITRSWAGFGWCTKLRNGRRRIKGSPRRWKTTDWWESAA